MKTSALFLIFMFTASALASQDDLLNLIDQTPEGKEIMGAIYLHLQTAGANLERGKIMEVLTTAKQNADKSERRQGEKIKRHKKNCKKDKALLRNHTNANERHEFTVSRHLNANAHALTKNQQFIDRSKKELDAYVSLGNLLKANRGKWKEWVNGRLDRMSKIVKLLRKARRQLINQHKAALGTEFVEVGSDFVSSFTEMRAELANIDDHLDGLRPIIENLIQTSATPAAVGKLILRSKLIKLLKTIIKTIRKRRDLLEQFNEGADSIFESLLKSFEENKTRITKLLERLAHEKNLLTKRQKSLELGHKRAAKISKLSLAVFAIKVRYCKRVNVRSAKLKVSIQKVRNIVAQIEEILQERFGKLKTFFLERPTKSS